jgi:protein-S-isoprenylcysteine O-methyltransferase Ste14
MRFHSGRCVAFQSTVQSPVASRSSSRRSCGDVLLFSVTALELALLVRLTSTFTFVDWIYLSQHLIVLCLAVMRRVPTVQDQSFRSGAAVVVSYAYPYAQIAWLGLSPGESISQSAASVLVAVAALLSLAGLVSLGTSFGIRPALRKLVTRGPYRLVRHPIYVAYVVSDIGYNLQESNGGSLLLMIVGWISLVYRIHAEERVLARDERWPAYAAAVRYRLVPKVW